MSKISSFRIINLNYNNNANKIEDEIFDFDGNSTLLSLRNGGGKTVLVQMMMAAFVHKRYRNTADRPFESFFTSNRPTFIMTEWKLDGGGGYVLTGMMVRKSQNDNDSSNEAIDIINFIYEYNENADYTIRNFPVTDSDGKQKKLKSFVDSKKLFEDLRIKKGSKFIFYDINQAVQQRQYFNKLLEYGINYDEWEKIIKNINNKESGLSDLFKEAKDEAGLVEKWFLPSVEAKLNKDTNRIKQFETILIKFIQQYEENSVKIKRQEIILKFKEDMEIVTKKAVENLEIISLFNGKGYKISALKTEIVLTLEALKNKENKVIEEIEKLYLEMNDIKFQQISYEIHMLLDELDMLNTEQNRLLHDNDLLEKEFSEIEKKYHIYQCARNYEDYLHEEQNLLILENKYQMLKNDEKDNLPQMQNLGYNLNLLYTEIVDATKENIKTTILEIEKLKTEKQELVSDNEKAKKEFDLYSEKLGYIKSKISSFSERENEFLKQYNIKLEKNILGFYEEGSFEVLENEYSLESEKLKKEITKNYSNLENKREYREALQRKIQDNNKILGQSLEKEKLINNLIKESEKEMEIRLKYMMYLSIPEEYRYNKESICKAFSEKISSLIEIEKKAERQWENQKNIIERLKHGIFFEIPEELDNLFKDLEINYVYGIDYLKKHPNLLEKSSLLPYGIIISHNEYLKLLNSEIKFFTSLPIPIFIKESLMEEGSVDSQVVKYFVSFNDKLLNEDEVKNIILEKEANYKELSSILEKKKEEIKFYSDMLNEIAFQKTDKSYNEELHNQIEKVIKGIKNCEDEINSSRIEKTKNDQNIADLNDKIKSEEIKNNEVIGILKALKDFEKWYDEYKNSVISLEKITALMEKSETETIERNKKIDNNNSIILDKKIHISDLEKELQNDKLKLAKFSKYTEGEIIKKDLVDIESAYNAMASKITVGIQEIEEQMESSRIRFDKMQSRLIDYAKKYSITDDDYKNLSYNKFREDEIEKDKNAITDSLKKLQKEIGKFEKEIAVAESKLQTKKNELLENFNTEEILSKNLIKDTEFVKRIKIIENSISTESSIQKSIVKKINNYDGNISALSEFDVISDYNKTESMEFNLEEIDKKELENLYVSMIREYRILREDIDKKSRELEKLLGNIISKEIYKDEFYYQPLSIILETYDRPEEMIRQINITIQSYDTLLEKILVDISFVETEKSKIIEMLFDYIFEINKNLDKIDRNSSITVNEKSIKMLRIIVPSWEENREMFTHRLKEYFENLIQSGLQCIMDNRNLEEMIGLRLTTKALYDEIVGIGQIIIKLYKIEAQREYQINWAQVSRNSGGEGFLSAFVVLSSLLSYMRRDESDLFIEKEEGKVIIMDNPFAQTNASHLLIPLMNMAKKCNTQLICLTGLGGESIYNRFDNIYVLNTIESAIQRDVQYLKAEHIKGETKVYKMSSSRIKTEESEQMTLLF